MPKYRIKRTDWIAPMFKKLLAAFGGKAKTSAHAPYQQEQLNTVYRMLFCDDPEQGGQAVFGAAPQAETVLAIAQDPNEESRLRLLAAHWLRANGQPAPSQEVLGVVVEVPLEEGLDVLAAYADGRARYINHTGRVAVFDGAPEEMATQARVLVASAIPDSARASTTSASGAPHAGHVRFTFLSVDGPRVHEGFFSDIVRDPLAAPVLENAQKLLDLVVRQGNAQ
jgi:hypothetical protein